MLGELAETIKALALSAGPLGILVGMFLESSIIPIPSELVLVTAGMVGFSPWQVAIWGGIGSTLGAIVGHSIGKYGGRPVLNKYGKYIHVTPNKLQFAENWFNRWGNPAILFSRLIPLVPYKVFSIGSGIARMRLRDFALFTLLGSIPRAFMLAYFGQALLQFKSAFLIIVALGLLLIVPLGMTKFRNRNKEESF